MACEMSDVSTVEVLLSFNPDLTIRAKVGKFARKTVVLINGAEFFCYAMQGGGTVLHAAVSAGHAGIIEALLDRGMSLAATDDVSMPLREWQKVGTNLTYVVSFCSINLHHFTGCPVTRLRR